MKPASSLFSADDRDAIKAAIGVAEGRTEAQIVPVVATASGRYDRAEDLFGVIFALSVVSVIWLAMQGPATDAWSGAHSNVIGLASILGLTLTGFIVGAWLASQFPALRTPFVGEAEMRAELERAARAAFQSQALRNTAASTGVLIYVSLYERMVHVIGDDTIAAHISQDQWATISEAVVEGMRRNAACEGVVAGIAQAGELLAQVLPRQSNNNNELADELIVLD